MPTSLPPNTVLASCPWGPVNVSGVHTWRRTNSKPIGPTASTGGSITGGRKEGKLGNIQGLSGCSRLMGTGDYWDSIDTHWGLMEDLNYPLNLL